MQHNIALPMNINSAKHFTANHCAFQSIQEINVDTHGYLMGFKWTPIKSVVAFWAEI